MCLKCLKCLKCGSSFNKTHHNSKVRYATMHQQQYPPVQYQYPPVQYPPVQYPAAGVPYPQYPAPVQHAGMTYGPPGASVQMMPFAQVPQAMDDDFEAYVPLPDKYYDVTNTIEQCCLFIHCPCNGCQTKKLFLDDQEAKLKVKSLLCSSTQRRPYAQLGSVDMISDACGCYTISSGLTPFVQGQGEQRQGGMSPGFGCDERLCRDIVNDLQDRQRKRGGVAQVF